MLLNLLQVTAPNTEDLLMHADSAKAAIGELAQGLATNPSETLQELGQQSITFGLKVLAALAIYIIGAWLIKRIKVLLHKRFVRKHTEKALASFILSFVSIALTIILIIITVGTLGVNTSSLAALLAAGGVAIGMALSGTIQNFAGGIMIMAFKPFKAGDYIEAQGYSGVVTAVSIVNTNLTTVDNKVIIIPNGTLFNGNINNYSKNSIRRVDWNICMEYGIDASACKEKLLQLISSDSRVIDSKVHGAEDPFVALSEFAANGIVFTVRAWVNTADYWSVYFDFNSTAYAELQEAGFAFPFPQLDVHLHDNKAAMPASARKE